MEENCLCIEFRMATKRKHNEVTLKTKYEASKEFDKIDKSSVLKCKFLTFRVLGSNFKSLSNFLCQFSTDKSIPLQLS